MMLTTDPGTGIDDGESQDTHQSEENRDEETAGEETSSAKAGEVVAGPLSTRSFDRGTVLLSYFR